jgi:hypothetical protein
LSNEPEAIYCGNCGFDLRKFAKINYKRSRKQQKQLLTQPVTDISSAAKLVIGTNLITIAGFFFFSLFVSGFVGFEFRSLIMFMFLIAAPLTVGYVTQKRLLSFSEMIAAAFVNFMALVVILIVFVLVTLYSIN